MQTNNTPLPLEKETGELFSKFPSFPPALTDFLVTIMPWLSLFGGIFGLLGLLAFFKIGGNALEVAGLAGYTTSWKFYVSVFGSALAAVISLLAFMPLHTQKRKGWELLYYSFLLSILIQLVTRSFVNAVVVLSVAGSYSRCAPVMETNFSGGLLFAYL